MAIIENLKDMNATELLKFMNDRSAYLPGNIQFEIVRSAIQVRSIESLVKSIDELRKSNDESSRTIKRWTKVLAGATIVLAIATIVLAFATVKLALR